MASKNLLVCLLFALFFTTSFCCKAQNKKDYNLLWRIEGNGLETPSYLFGTMHVKDARAFNFSDSVLLAIKKCDFFALELQPDSMMNEIFNKYFEDDQAFKELFNEEEYQQLNERLKKEKGYDLDKMNVKNPRTIRYLLTPSVSKPDDKQTFVDAYLYGIAKTFRKKVFGLEDVKDQSEIFFGASKEEQRKELLELVESSSDSYRKSMEAMVEIYSSGNLDEIQDLMDHYGLVDSIMIGRNRVMTNSLDKLMNQSSTFAAVGCAHLPGENGVIDMLKKEGYTVKRVEASFSGVADKYKIDPLKMEWHNYQDKNFGFELKTPGKLIPADIIPGMNLMMYPDLTTESAFFIMTIDFRGAKDPVNEDELIKKMIDSYKSNNSFKSVKKKNISKNGLAAKEVIGKGEEETTVIHLMAHNNIFYCQFATYKPNTPNLAYIDHFFNSFKTFTPLPQKQAEWTTYTNSAGAFQASLPLPPKEIQKSYAEQGGIELKIFVSTDLSNMTNYMVAYNDYPLGYYLQNPGEAFDGFKEEYKGLGNLLSEPDTIWLGGYEGREYEVMLQDKYYTIARVYLRGNRIYKVIQQNLNEGEIKLHQDDFLSSFSFAPFEEAELKEHQPKDAGFKFKVFPDYKMKVDSAINHNSYLGQSTSYVFKDPKSGGVYMLDHSKLKDYFMVKHIDTLFSRMIKTTLGWSDSLISEQNVELDGLQAKEIISLNKYNKQKTRHRIWLDDQIIFYMGAHVAEEAIFSETSNDFFESYERSDKASTFDIYASKATKIIDGLSSEDSLKRKASLGALSYYEFRSEDIPLIHQALSTTYADDSLEAGTRAKLIGSLLKMDAPGYLEFIEKLYSDKKTTNALKLSILAAAINSEKKAGNELFLKLFNKEAPHSLGSKGWKIFRPFIDSLELAAQHYEKLLSHIGKEDYRPHILSLSYKMLQVDSLKGNLVRTHYKELTKFAQEDLDHYINSADSSASENIFPYNTKISHYLNLANSIRDKAFTEVLTSRLLSSNITGWMRTETVAARIFNELETDKKEISRLLEAMESRYTIMKSFNKANKLRDVPKKYRKQDEFAKLCFYEAISIENTPPTELKLLGHILVDGSRVYVFSFSNEYDKDTKQLGLSGFYSSNGKTLDFENHRSYTPWEPLEKDWKNQAKEYVSHLKEYGY